MENAYQLSKVIDKLRGDLNEAVKNAPTDGLNFTVEEVDVELEIVTTSIDEANGEIGLWVLKTGAKITNQNATSHKIVLKLKPNLLDENGSETEVKVNSRSTFS